jgi:hypothetical protein
MLRAPPRSLPLVLCAAAAGIAAAGDRGPDGDGARALAAGRFECGSGPGLAEAMARRHARARAGAPPAAEVAAGFDVGNVAVVVDAGNLVPASFADTTAIAQQFTASHADVFDTVAIFLSSAYNADVQIESGFAFHRRVASDVLGIGVSPIDRAGELGLTTTRLRSILQLNDLLEYPPRLDDRMVQFEGDVLGVEILGHETAHQFVAYAEPSGGGSLGRGDAHWSFFLNSEASVMEGNRWAQSGNRFTSVEAFERFSQLDLYLMGMLAPEAVIEPIFIIDNPKQTGGRGPTSFPEVGVTVQGTRRDVTIADFVAVEGPRVPSHLDAPHELTLALALVVPAGVAVPPGDLDRVESFRRTLGDWLSSQTGGVGSLGTALPGVDVAADFEAETFAGPAPLAVAFQDRSAGAVTSWSWDFGDGGASTERDPAHLYAQDGFYTVSLTVDGPGGPSTRVRRHLVLVAPFAEAAAEDFEGPALGWTRSAADDATSGRWVLDEPLPTERLGIAVQPDGDASPEPGLRCWITGNLEDPAGVAGADDVDGGATTLVSDLYDLAGAQAPILEYALWLSNELGGEPGTDRFRVEASADGGATWWPLDATRRGDRAWRTRQVRLTEAILPTGQVRLRFVASDLGLGSLVEAGLDEVRLRTLSGLPDADGDALPDAMDNCAAAVNPRQEDADQDGFGSACDCNDADASAGLFPGDGAILRAVPEDPDRFEWTAEPLALDYNVYKGILPAAPFAYVHACFEKRSTDTQTFDPTAPPSGGLHYYLVAPRNRCGEAGLGRASDGSPRPLSTPCPPPFVPGG